MSHHKMIWGSAALGFAGCLAFCLPGRAAENVQTLWQIGRADQSIAEFALAPGDYARFLQEFGNPDRAYYIGISKPESDWPCVLPGPLDNWGGSSGNGRWDPMNTPPIGFVLAQIPAAGHRALIIAVAEAHPQHPLRLRITVNDTIFERDLAPGGSVEGLSGNLASAKPQELRLEFSAALLRPGYNEIALRSTRGSWLIFDALRLETPAEVKLSPPSQTVIRSIAPAPYAVAASRKTPASVRVELFRASAPGKLKVEIQNAGTQELDIQPGLQALEV